MIHCRSDRLMGAHCDNRYVQVCYQLAGEIKNAFVWRFIFGHCLIDIGATIWPCQFCASNSLLGQCRCWQRAWHRPAMSRLFSGGWKVPLSRHIATPATPPVAASSPATESQVDLDLGFDFHSDVIGLYICVHSGCDSSFSTNVFSFVNRQSHTNTSDLNL